MRLAFRPFVFALVAFCSACAGGAAGGSGPEDQEFPVPSDYPPGTMEQISFQAGGGHDWRLSALTTPARPDADWKIVIVTGTPSWSDYWAPTLAAMATNREVIVADRPGFSQSEPAEAVPDLTQQADALAPMLQARPGERVLLVGQSFGAPVAALMASRYPDQVDALLLVSAFFGDAGPTARRMIGVGKLVRPMLPRDLRNSITEVSAQRRQLPAVWQAFANLRQPVVFVHGDSDSFVPLAADQRIADEYSHPLVAIPGGDHFLNACCVPALVDAMEQTIRMANVQTAASLAPAAP